MSHHLVEMLLQQHFKLVDYLVTMTYKSNQDFWLTQVEHTDIGILQTTEVEHTNIILEDFKMEVQEQV